MRTGAVAMCVMRTRHGLCGGGGAVSVSTQSLHGGCGRETVIHSPQAIFSRLTINTVGELAGGSSARARGGDTLGPSVRYDHTHVR